MPEDIIRCPLDEAAKQDPGRPAIFWGSRRITYLQLNQYVNAALKSFKERGVHEGSRVALLCENSVEFVIVILSLWRLGAMACFINPKFPDDNIRSLVFSLKPQAVVVAQGFKLSGVKSVVDITDLIVYDIKDAFLSGDASRMPSFEPGQEAAVIFTSGSSGAPKAAVLTYGNLYFNALGSNECIALAKEDRWLLSLPLYHVSGLGILLRCLIARAAMVVAPREDSERLLQEGKVTHVSMVSTQLYRLLHDGVFMKPESLKAVLLGGSAIPQNILQKSLELGLPMYMSYGLTEMASQVATGRFKRMGQGCARVLPHRELKIDADGEICVRGKTLFKGYADGAAVQLPLDDEGWFHTGDLGLVDSDGCLKVFGRRDDMFISGGENIHPQEIESELLKIDFILEAVIVPKEDREFGQRPVAFIRWEKDAAIHDEEALKKILKQRLPAFKVPVAFYPWPAMPEAEGLKVDRRYLRELARTKKR